MGVLFLCRLLLAALGGVIACLLFWEHAAHVRRILREKAAMAFP
jgi:hypothetical protein